MEGSQTPGAASSGSGFQPRPFVPAAETSPEADSTSPAAAQAAAEGDAFAERPEVYVGAAFAGGLALAGLLRFLGR